MAITADFGLTAKDYATHRQGFPPELVQRLRREGVVAAGQCLLDVGTGTGTLARQFAEMGLETTGVDVAPALLEQARALDAAAGVTVDYRIGKAEDLPVADGSQDVVVAGQCWHWFDAPKATSEALRALVPGGRVVVCHFDWLPLPGNMVEATEALILRYNPSWHMGGGTGLYPRWLVDLAAGGFVDLVTFSFDLDVSYSHERWRGRIRASAGVAASLPPDKVAAFDADLAEILAKEFPQDPLRVPHRVWAVVGRKPTR